MCYREARNTSPECLCCTPKVLLMSYLYETCITLETNPCLLILSLVSQVIIWIPMNILLNIESKLEEIRSLEFIVIWEALHGVNMKQKFGRHCGYYLAAVCGKVL